MLWAYNRIISAMDITITLLHGSESDIKEQSLTYIQSVPRLFVTYQPTYLFVSINLNIFHVIKRKVFFTCKLYTT